MIEQGGLAISKLAPAIGILPELTDWWSSSNLASYLPMMSDFVVNQSDPGTSFCKVATYI